MPGPTTAALKEALDALKERFARIEEDVHDLREADSRHSERDSEEFEVIRERIGALAKDVEEGRRIVGDVSRDVQEVEKTVASLELTRAGNRWIDRLINAALIGAGGLVGAALLKWLSG